MNISVERSYDILKETICHVLGRKPTCTLGLPGGRSVIPILLGMIDADVPWQQVHVFFIDERYVSLESEESNYSVISKYFADPLKMKAPKTNGAPMLYPLSWKEPLSQEKTQIGSSLEKYQQTFETLGGFFDVVLAGVGEDGHCASLFPNHPSIFNDENKYIIVENAPKQPPRRISASRKLLQRTTFPFLLFLGENKMAALEMFRNDNISIFQCPSKLFLQNPECKIITDLE